MSIKHAIVRYGLIAAIAAASFGLGEWHGQRQKMGMAFFDKKPLVMPAGVSVMVLKDSPRSEIIVSGLQNGAKHGLVYHSRDGHIIELCAYEHGKEICGLRKVPKAFDGQTSSWWEYSSRDQRVFVIKDFDDKDVPGGALMCLLENALSPQELGAQLDRAFAGDGR